ncbi:MAG: hypothetical protein CML56_06730 [Rhodobacteraceae bacterium]|nr:hypothetical protein [Paracoccaceae bacterium]
MINNIRVLIKSAIKALPCILISTMLASADTLFNSEWSNPDGSKSESTVTFYENIGPKGTVGHYAGSTQNRLVGKYNSDYTVFEGYWVQDESSQQCSYSVDGSQFYGRVFLTSSDGKEFDGLWGYCDEAPNLRWQGWIAAVQEAESAPLDPKNNNKIGIQKALNFFDYSAGRPDGIVGQKTKNAIADVQMCWRETDPYWLMVEGTSTIGALSQQQKDFRRISYSDAYTSGIQKGNCYKFIQLISSRSGESSSVENKLSRDANDGFCEYEGERAEPVFYCTFANKKSVTICKAYSDKGDWNSFSYKYGKIGQSPELELKAEMPKSYFPTVVAKTTIEAVSPFCTTGDGDPCETNHSLHYDFRDTSSQFLFENGDYEYLINVSSWLGASFRAYEGNLKVNKIKRNLPYFHPQYRSNITSIECDQSSVKNSVWDGTYVDGMINNFSLCWVDMGDEGAEWQQCLP